MPAAPTRRTQSERSAETRSRLLEATVSCLVERGYAGTTTIEVCRRAGVSHGSLLHHYGTRDRLLRAALEHLYSELRSRVVDGLASFPEGPKRVDAMVDLMWSVFSSPPFKAVIELWLAAANDPDLGMEVGEAAAVFDAEVFPTARRLFPEQGERLPDFESYIAVVFQTMQGMGLAQATLGRRQGRDRRRIEADRQHMLDLLKRWLRDAFDSIDREAQP